jgi:cysteine desulfurase / selenocysteine lyase
MFNRKDFPILQDSSLIYLDSAATSMKPTAVIEALSYFYRHDYGTVHRAIYKLAAKASADYSAAREFVRQFLHAAFFEEIIFTKGTTEAINLVAFSFGEAFVRDGDEILISGQEHHSNIVPWQLLCARKKAHLKVIPLLDDGLINIEAYKKMVSSKTKLVSVTHMSNVLGIENPIANMARDAHAVGAKILVDGAQSVAHIPVDVQALDCDFFVFSGHKIYGPTGVGILYGKKDLLESMPPYQGGGDMIETVTWGKTTFQKPPLKFEAGTPMIAEVIGLKEALQYFITYKDYDYERKLIVYLEEGLKSIQRLHFLGPKTGSLAQRKSLLTFTVDGMHSLDLATFLDCKGVAVRSGHLCAQPLLHHFGKTSVVRISLAPYNTKEELDSFVSILKTILSKATLS